MRGARIYARKKSFYKLPPHPNPLPQGERELHTMNEISYAIALLKGGRVWGGVRKNCWSFSLITNCPKTRAAMAAGV